MNEEYQNELELKVHLRGNDAESIRDNLNRFQDLFMYVFKEDIDNGSVEALVTILKDRGLILDNRGVL